MVKKESVRLPKIEGYSEGEGFILIARKSKGIWIAAETIIVPKAMKDLSAKMQDDLMIETCKQGIIAVQELYRKEHKSNNIKGGRKNGQRVSE